MTSRRPSALDEELTLGMPSARGLYDPRFEHDSCGVGFVCDIKGVARNQIVRAAEHINCCMVHRGGVGYEKNTGDGAGILTALPHKLFAKFAKRALKTETTAARPLRRRQRFPAARDQRAPALQERHRRAHQGRGPGAARLAQSAGRPGRRRSRQGGAPRDADDRTAVHRRRARRRAATRSNASCT